MIEKLFPVEKLVLMILWTVIIYRADTRLTKIRKIIRYIQGVEDVNTDLSFRAPKYSRTVTVFQIIRNNTQHCSVSH